MPEGSTGSGDGILALKLQWRRERIGHGEEPECPVIQAGEASGLGWGGLWHVCWSRPAEELPLARALDEHAWNRILVSSTCPRPSVLDQETVPERGRWLGFFRNAVSTLNPAQGVDDKLTTAGYVITRCPLPEPACELYGESVARLMTTTGTWFGVWKDGRCVGWILAAFRCTGGVLLEALHVLEPWRHQGLAARLVEAAGGGQAVWLLAGDTPSTRAFWAGRGFGIAGGYTLYRRDRG